MWKRMRDMVCGAVLGALVVTGILAANAGDSVPTDGNRGLPFSPQNLMILKQARSILELYHVDGDKGPGEKKLFYGALKGLVGATGDPYTRFVEPEQLKEESIEMEGQYGGLGIYIGQRDGKTLVISPIEGTPADRAGLKPMDEIVKVGEKVIVGMDQNEVVKMLRGPANTKVQIWVRRNGKDQLLKFSLTREVIRIKSVRFEMLPGGVAYIRLVHFNQKSGAELAEAIRSAEAKKAKGILLDLRNNPGGLLNAAVDVASLFLDGGLVVGMKGRVEKANDTLYAESGKDTKLPTVVLINEGSASASEIVAGALQDRTRALLVGKKSFGKGSVQILFNLPDGAGMYVTIARYHTPSGKVIDHVGLVPDVKVDGEPLRDLKKDKQVQKGLEVLRSRTKAP